jgi:uncharacterized membrane protein YgcG
MIPKFKENNWGEGILEGIYRINNLVSEKPLDSEIKKSNVIKPNSNSGLTNLKVSENASGEELAWFLLVFMIVALFTTKIGKIILISLLIGGVIAKIGQKYGNIVTGVLSATISGLLSYFIFNEWLIAIILGGLFGLFGVVWLFELIMNILLIVANSRGGSSRGSGGTGSHGGYSGGGGKFGGGGSSGSW